MFNRLGISNFFLSERNDESDDSDSTFIVSDSESSESDVGGHLRKKTNREIDFGSDSDTKNVPVISTEPNLKASKYGYYTST